MHILWTLIICIVCSQRYDQRQNLLSQTVDHHLQKLSENIHESNINYQEIQLNRVLQTQITPGQLYICYTRFSPQQRINVNLYSTDVEFGFVHQIQFFNQSSILSGNGDDKDHKQFFKFKATRFAQDILQKTQLKQKLKQNVQYKHYLSFQSNTNQVEERKQNYEAFKLIMLAIYVPPADYPQISSDSHNPSFSVNFIITTNQTFISKATLQKFIQYKLLKDQIHSFRVNATEIFTSLTQTIEGNKNIKLIEEVDEFFLFHTLHIVGDFQYNVSIFSNSKNQLQPREKQLIQTNHSESTFQFNKSLLQNPKHSTLQTLSDDFSTYDKSFFDLQILFEVRCKSTNCIFITQIEKNTQIRQVVPGIPYIYSINSLQIFEFNNPFDLDLFVDMNKKNGFPQYQICSTKQTGKQNDCIKQLKNPASTMHMFEVKQKDDKLHALGRNNQIVINTEHESYCFKCSYYLALYADYDNVLGMITFKNTRSSTIIPEGNSITKVLKRKQTDSYIVYGLNSRLLFEKFSGKYEVSFEEIDLQLMHSFQQLNNNPVDKIRIRPQAKTIQENYYSIDLKDQIEQFYQSKSYSTVSKQSSNQQNKIYKIFIQTQNNYPSTYYSMIVVNDESRKIVLKDGVPFFNKQKNKVSVFKYLTQNLETQSFGTIIINSNHISQIQLQIYGKCLTLQQTKNSIKNYKMEKEDESTLNTLRNRIKLSNSNSEKKYQLQKIQNKKINLMANRIDIIIEPQMCKSYIIKMINNASQSFITYQILVSFIDSIILPLNNQVPGILQYPGKIIQIYEVFVPEKSNLSILINFCRSSKSRMQIYRNKQALFTQSSDQKVLFSSQSQLEQIIYLAHAGVFYITIEFFGFSSILEYTILVKQHQVQQGFYYIDLSKQQQQIQYSVKDGRFFSTTYKLYFSPIFLKHWSKDVQRDVQYFQTNYFILQSNSYPLLKRASNCKGQFFSDIVNHHQHFKQVKLQMEKLTFHPPKKQSEQFHHESEYSRGYYSYQYQTNTPLSFLLIVPVISKSTSSNELSVIPYWQFDKKSRQPYTITQLYNGKIYSIFEHWFVSIVIWMEEFVDFHIYQSFIVMMVVICSCLPVTCCLLICVYRTKVNIEFYCNLLYAKIEKYFQDRRQRSEENQMQLGQNEQIEMNHQQAVAIPSDQNEAFSQGNVDVTENNFQLDNDIENDSGSQSQQTQRQIEIISDNDDNFPSNNQNRHIALSNDQNEMENSTENM